MRDDTRMREAAPTVRALAERGAVVIACSHLGRAKGKSDPALSLAPVAPVLARLRRPAGGVRRRRGRRGGEAAVAAARPGDVLLLENLRFHAGEEKNDPALCASARARSPTSTSTTPSAPPTAPTPRPPGWRRTSPAAPPGR